MVFIHSFLKLFEKILIGSGLALLALIIGIQLDFPQHVINKFLQQKLTGSETEITVEGISGFFPFSFKIGEIHLTHKDQADVLLQDLTAFFDWKTFQFSFSVDKTDIKLPLTRDKQENEQKTQSLAFDPTSSKPDKAPFWGKAFYTWIQENPWLAKLGHLTLKEISTPFLPESLSLSYEIQPHQKKKPSASLTLEGNIRTYPFKLHLSDIKLTPLDLRLNFLCDVQSPKGPLSVKGAGAATALFLKLSSQLLQSPYPELAEMQAAFSCATHQVKEFLCRTHILNDSADSFPNSTVNSSPFAELTFITRKKPFSGQIKLDLDGHGTLDISRKTDQTPVSFVPSQASSLISILTKRQFEKVAQADFCILPDHSVSFDVSYFFNPLNSEQTSSEEQELNEKKDSINQQQKKLLMNSKPQNLETPHYIQCIGNLKNKVLQIDHFIGMVLNRSIVLKKSVTLDFEQKALSDVVLSIDQQTFSCSSIKFEKGQQAKFSLENLTLSSQDESVLIHWGTYGIHGEVLLKDPAEKDFEINATLRSSSKTLKTKGGISFQNFEPKLSGSLFCSAHHIALQNVTLSRGKESLRFNCDLFPKKWRDLKKDLKKLLDKKYQTLFISEFESPVRLQGSLSGNMGLDVLSPLFWNGDVIKGKVNINMNFSGHLCSPKIEGTLNVANGYYENIGNGVVLKDIQLKAKTQDNALKIDSIRISDGTSIGTDSLHEIAASNTSNPSEAFNVTRPPQGLVGGKGYIHFFDEMRHLDPQFDLDLHCQFFQVAYTDVVKARATGNLKIKGPLLGKSASPIVTGTVELNPGHVNIEAALEEPTSFNITLKGGSTEERPFSIADPNLFRLGITLLIGKEVVVTGSNGLKCFLKGTMQACGPLRDPHLEGQVSFDETRDNTYNLFGRVMMAQSGTIKYDALLPNIPYLNVTMLTTIKDTTIFANVFGYTSHLNYTLRSTPPLSNETILSLLLFKQEMGELTFDQKEQVQSFSSQMLQDNPLGFLDKIRHNVGLDSLEVVEKQDLFSGESTQSIRLGKQLKNVRVYIDQDIATSKASKTNSRMTVSYAFTPQFGFKACVGTDKSQFDVGLQWSKRY